jgi:ABC-type Fe3+/spermidine/putrescine transport system ATPase subunit
MINIESITKRYGKVEAVVGLTLDIFPNEILGIIGPSGCGKTTLLRLVAGLERPDEGEICIDNEAASTPAQMMPPHDRKLSMVFQDLALWPHMTVGEHIEFMTKKGHSSKQNLKSNIKNVLKEVNLIDHINHYPHELSGGEKQRLAIARSIASKPSFLLMDEPFSNLDSLLKEELQELVMGLKNNHQMGIIYVSHIIEEVFTLADRIAIMSHGTMIQVGTKDDVLSNPKHSFVSRILKI